MSQLASQSLLYYFIKSQFASPKSNSIIAFINFTLTTAF